MTNEAASGTAYFILSPSGDFPSQPYNVILYQWMDVLEQQGVPPNHVFAWVRNIDGITLLHPRPWITDNPLDAPEGWQERVVTGPRFEDGIRQLFNALRDWGRDMSVRRVVVIVLGTGESMSVFSGNGELDRKQFSSIHSECGNKPVLLILDFDRAAEFAAAAAATTKDAVFYLTSGNFSSPTTAVVLCDTADKLAPAPGLPGVRYAIYGTMFHRSLFQCVVFTHANPRLTEMADLLNGYPEGSQGFWSISASGSRWCEDTRLRDFFGGPVAADALRGILPPRPKVGFIDDIDRFVDKALVDDGYPLMPPLNKFVRLEFDRQGELQLLGHGQWQSINPIHEAVRSHIRLGPSLPPIPGHFPDVQVVGKAVDLLLERMKDGGAAFLASREEPVELSHEDSKKWERIYQFLLRENKADPRDMWELDDFRSYLGLGNLEMWCNAIREAQIRLHEEFPRVGSGQTAEI
jgi:hypothetical protein